MGKKQQQQNGDGHGEPLLHDSHYQDENGHTRVGEPGGPDNGSDVSDNPPLSKGYVYTCLLGYSMSFIIFGSQVSILGPTIKPLADRLGVDEPDLSPLFTALGVSCIVSGTPSGWLVDRLPSHYVLMGSLVVEAVGFALVPWMPSVVTLTALFFLVCFTYNFTNRWVALCGFICSGLHCREVDSGRLCACRCASHTGCGPLEDLIPTETNQAPSCFKDHRDDWNTSRHMDVVALEGIQVLQIDSLKFANNAIKSELLNSSKSSN
ncbi:hypothetical protein DUNSADRAFT_8058 [Dunaliella salina]|uniref:Major facilitator superfamily (MFS) profile domain-containing protein n=1 Tax=Dunaliella salina TaxID=3046 RepID=A0ABQ7GK58_DUNSA|nr:hypothetical protein DUNSADRAFT_8058 [Dunaliella salina]|eukprot:KAF5835001.1 hypothetical protein DUNSADRAFT_8058 [Dunaliella salina]